MANQYSCLENPMNSMKRQKYMTQKDEAPTPRSVDVQYTTGEKWKRHPVVNVSSGESKSNAIKKNFAQEPGMLGP